MRASAVGCMCLVALVSWPVVCSEVTGDGCQRVGNALPGEALQNATEERPDETALPLVARQVTRDPHSGRRSSRDMPRYRIRVAGRYAAYPYDRSSRERPYSESLECPCSIS
jgi:hypothetical protein